jgi:hypothetical protein
MKLRWLAIPLVAGAVAALRDPARRQRLGLAGGARPAAPGLDVTSVRTTAAGDVESEDRSGQWADDGGAGAGGGQSPTTARLGASG